HAPGPGRGRRGPPRASPLGVRPPGAPLGLPVLGTPLGGKTPADTTPAQNTAPPAPIRAAVRDPLLGPLLRTATRASHPAGGQQLLPRPSPPPSSARLVPARGHPHGPPVPSPPSIHVVPGPSLLKPPRPPPPWAGANEPSSTVLVQSRWPCRSRAARAVRQRRSQTPASPQRLRRR